MKKVWIILGIVAFLLIIVIFKLFLKNKKEMENIIPVYNADVICSLDGIDTFEDGTQEYSLRAYLTVKDNLVTKAILVSVGDDSDISMTRSYVEEYNEIKGINAQVTLKNGSLVTEVIYDYETIDLNEVRSKLGYLLIDDSIFVKASSLPVSLDLYKEYELQNYTCN